MIKLKTLEASGQLGKMAADLALMGLVKDGDKFKWNFNLDILFESYLDIIGTDI